MDAQVQRITNALALARVAVEADRNAEYVSALWKYKEVLAPPPHFAFVILLRYICFIIICASIIISIVMILFFTLFFLRLIIIMIINISFSCLVSCPWLL